MKTVCITGGTGLIGWHLRCRLLEREDMNVRIVPREMFTNVVSFADFLSGCNAVIHLAGVNRGPDTDVEQVNIDLAEKAVAALYRKALSPHLVFSSSIHAGRKTPYGKGKLGAEYVIKEWAEATGAPCTILRLPHVFGECGRPYHNSVVSTFCHQLATDKTPHIDTDGDLELLHAQDVASLLIDAIDNRTTGRLNPSGREMKVSELLQRLESMKKTYSHGIIPRLDDDINLQLFNTLRSYLFPSFYPIRPTLHTDERGWLFEVVKTDHGGQAFLSSTKPGVTRGEHFHFRKVERFAVLQGKARIRVRRLFQPQIYEFSVTGSEPTFLDIPTLHSHDITNIGNDDLLTLFWSHQIFDPQHPDTLRRCIEDPS